MAVMAAAPAAIAGRQAGASAGVAPRQMARQSAKVVSPGVSTRSGMAPLPACAAVLSIHNRRKARESRESKRLRRARAVRPLHPLDAGGWGDGLRLITAFLLAPQAINIGTALAMVRSR